MPGSSSVATLATTVWLVLVLEPHLTGRPPALGGATTYLTPALDFAFVLPAILLAGVLLRRREPTGYALAVPTLGILVFLGPALVGQLVAQTLAGIAFTPQELVAFFGMFALMSGGGIVAFVSVLRAAAGSQTVPLQTRQHSRVASS